MAQQNYCSQCGAPLKDTDKYCSNCGAKVGNTGNYREWNNTTPNSTPDPSPQNTMGAFPHMLAYIPGLFWVPLAVDSKDKNNRECANQGLLLLLYCIILPIIFSIVGAILAYVGIASVADTSAFVNPVTPYSYVNPYTYTGFDSFGAFFSNFGASFSNFGELFKPFGGIAFSNAIVGLLISLPCVLLSLYVPINSIWGFIHCINHREPHILPIIGKIKIIK